jgi:hypothetical protein
MVVTEPLEGEGLTVTEKATTLKMGKGWEPRIMADPHIVLPLSR